MIRVLADTASRGVPKLFFASMSRRASAVDGLNALTAHIAVLDRDAGIVPANDAWTRFANENGRPFGALWASTTWRFASNRWRLTTTPAGHDSSSWPLF